MIAQQDVKRLISLNAEHISFEHTLGIGMNDIRGNHQDILQILAGIHLGKMCRNHVDPLDRNIYVRRNARPIERGDCRTACDQYGLMLMCSDKFDIRIQRRAIGDDKDRCFFEGCGQSVFQTQKTGAGKDIVNAICEAKQAVIKKAPSHRQRIELFGNLSL